MASFTQHNYSENYPHSSLYQKLISLYCDHGFYLCIFHNLSVHLLFGYLNCFQLRAIMSRAAVNIHVKVLLNIYIFISLVKILRSRIFQYYGCCTFSFISNCKILFQSGSTTLHSHQKCMQIPVAPNS